MVTNAFPFRQRRMSGWDTAHQVPFNKAKHFRGGGVATPRLDRSSLEIRLQSASVGALGYQTWASRRANYVCLMLHQIPLMESLNFSLVAQYPPIILPTPQWEDLKGVLSTRKQDLAIHSPIAERFSHQAALLSAFWRLLSPTSRVSTRVHPAIKAICDPRQAIRDRRDALGKPRRTLLASQGEENSAIW